MVESDVLLRQVILMRKALNETTALATATEVGLASQLCKVQADLQEAQRSIQRLEDEAEVSRRELTQKLEAERAAGRRELEEAQARAAAERRELEKRLRNAETVAEHRTHEFYRAHAALVSRLRLRPREVVAAWSVDEQREALLALVQEHRRCLDALRPADFQACSAEARRDLARKLLEAIKVASVSWLAAVSELFGAQPADLYRRVAGWYAQEGVVTDDVRLHQDVVRLKGVLDGTDLSPLYGALRDAVQAGRCTVFEVLLSCSGQSAEETMLSVTGLSLEEVTALKQHRAAVMRFLQTRQAVEARGRREAAQLGALGFLHHGAGADSEAEPMEAARACRLVARVLSRKAVEDRRAAAAGRPRPNVMRLTRGLLGRGCATGAEAKQEVARLVAAVRELGEKAPRLRVFGLLAGMDPGRPWLERAAGFVCAFYTRVAEGLWADPALLADFARLNGLVLSDPEDAAATDRLRWVLADRDVKVPAVVLLKAAMSACELHPCGCGYPREQAQRLVDAACGPPADYAAAQEAALQAARAALRKLRAEARSLAEDARLDVVFHRLSRTKSVPAKMEELRRTESDGGLEFVRRRQAELARLNSKIQRISASLGGRSAKSSGAGARPRAAGGGGLRVQECGASVEAGATGWLDVFCRELLVHWFEQREVIEARMIQLFDEFDLVIGLTRREREAMRAERPIVRHHGQIIELSAALAFSLKLFSIIYCPLSFRTLGKPRAQ